MNTLADLVGTRIDNIQSAIDNQRMAEDSSWKDRPIFYCPTCRREVTDPLTCGDCSAVICRVCGTPLEEPDELAMG
jgi:hypothetical protein